MATIDDLHWFKTTFARRIANLINGKVFDVDMLTALAYQETGELWGEMRHNNTFSANDIAALCCGDTLDADKGRVAFPRTKSDLLAVQKGSEMFDIARQALLNMASHVPGYKFAFNKPNKFCHGFGIYQYDLQFFPGNASYFLNKEYEIFENSLAKALGELEKGLVKVKLQKQTAITDLEFCHVAICYNTGGFNPAHGLRQGYQSGGRYYGEAIRDFLALARTITSEAGAIPVSTVVPGKAVFSSDINLNATGPALRVDVENFPLRLRSSPSLSSPLDANVIATMPDGQEVRAITGTKVNNFIEIEVVLGGSVFRGFASGDFLVPATGTRPPVLTENVLPEAHLKPATTLITKRTGIATARSLNEADMPGRIADNPAGLRNELGKIISWLDVENPSHKRYKPRDGFTFCNIYAHDYCALSGVYLPRVWWTAKALARLENGQSLSPLLGETVDEVRANDLYRWLRDFGERFGWRRAISLDELQNHANLGGIGLIVARRRNEGRSGHIVLVVPETASETAKHDTSGRVEYALQSQAGSVNFKYGLGTRNWWKDERFAEAAFWMHK